MTILQTAELCDEEIIRGLINGHKKSAGFLFEKYNKDIYYICRRKQILHEDAAEIVSDVLYEIILNIEKFDPERSALRSWICMIANRRAIDFIRRNARKGEILKDDSFWDNLSVIEESNPGYDNSGFYDIMRSVLECLSDREKSVLSLALQNHEHKEIAEKMNIEYGNVKTIYSRALKKAKDIYNQMIDEGK